MLRIKVAHGRKVGEVNYSSRSFHAEVELEVGEQDAAKIGERLAAAWTQLRAAVDAQVAATVGPPVNGHAPVNGHGPASAATNGHGPSAAATNGHAPTNAPANGNGHGGTTVTRPEAARVEPRPAPTNEARSEGDRISSKQKGFLLGLGAKARMRLQDLNARAREMFGDEGLTIHELSRSQASALIEELKSSETRGAA